LNKLNYIFDVDNKAGKPMRGFLDTETQQIVIYDDSQGKELFRIGGEGQNVQGVSQTKKKLTTVTFVIRNMSANKETATLFASNIEPLVQPLGVTVTIKGLDKYVSNSHNYLRRDILSKKLKIVGLNCLVQNQQQFNNELRFGTINPNGLITTNPFSLLNYLSRYQVAQNRVIIGHGTDTKFNWDVNQRSILYVPIESQSEITLIFTIIDIEDIDEPITSEYKNINKNVIKKSDAVLEKVGDVNFNGGNDDKKNSTIGLMKFVIVVLGTVFIIKTIINNTKN